MSPPQNMIALARANEIRIAGAKHRNEIAALPRQEATRQLAHSLLNPPDAIQHMRIGHLVSALPYYGPMTGNRLLADARIYNPQLFVGPGRRKGVGRLSERQRQELASLLLNRVAS